MKLLRPITFFSVRCLMVRTVVGVTAGVLVSLPLCVVVRLVFYALTRTGSYVSREIDRILGDSGSFMKIIEHPYSQAGITVSGCLGGILGVVYYSVFRHRPVISVDDADAD